MLVGNLRLFLGYFMKFEGLNNTISDTLISLDIANNFQILKKLYVRDINKKFIVFVTKKWNLTKNGHRFLQKPSHSYVTVVVYIHGKYS